VAEPGTQPRLVALVRSGACDSLSRLAGSEPSATSVPHGAQVEPVVTPASQRKHGPNLSFATVLPRSTYRKYVPEKPGSAEGVIRWSR